MKDRVPRRIQSLSTGSVCVNGSTSAWVSGSCPWPAGRESRWTSRWMCSSIRYDLLLLRRGVCLLWETQNWWWRCVNQLICIPIKICFPSKQVQSLHTRRSEINLIFFQSSVSVLLDLVPAANDCGHKLKHYNKQKLKESEVNQKSIPSTGRALKDI